ncbi:transcriptional regulator [Burkholderiales bacterium JOSHI_001]|nr:transcriptional regulator [Burkholderiales bacterium JOSHI_001]
MPNDPNRLPPLDRLAVFDAAARHLSFTKAAAERFITQSAVSRQVAALEEELGLALFRRRHRALELTDDGRQLAEGVGQAIATVRDALATLRAPGRREVLAVTTTPGLASLWLIPRLADFVSHHPGVDVRIDASYQPRPLAADGFDLAIRYTTLDAASGLPLFGESIVPMCSPRLLRASGLPLKTPADLARHTLLQMDSMPGKGPPLEWQSWFRAMALGPITPAATLSFTNYDAAVAAAVAGQGVVLGRRPLVDTLLRQRALVAPIKGAKASAHGYTVVVEPAASRKPAVQALVNWLLAQARGT